jgi:hypothetical protein
MWLWFRNGFRTYWGTDFAWLNIGRVRVLVLGTTLAYVRGCVCKSAGSISG